jgi:hypothetical protein
MRISARDYNRLGADSLIALNDESATGFKTVI